MIIFIILLIIAIALLIAYNIYIKKNFQAIEKSKQRLDDLSIVNSLIQIAGTLRPVDQKLVMINNMLIEKFKLDYSSIVIFDGKTFTVKASNVENKIEDEIRNVYLDPAFKDSVVKRVPKYVTVEEETRELSYLKEQRARAKTAVFFPLYIDSVFIGFWLIESKKMQAFRDIDLEIMTQIKDRILDIIKTMSFQSNIENMVMDDKFSKLKTAEYLFTDGKSKLDSYNLSTIIMLRIANLEIINEKYSREAGNKTITNAITAIINFLEAEHPGEYIAVRYLGPTFAIAFPGQKPEDLEETINKIKIVSESTMILSSELNIKENKTKEKEENKAKEIIEKETKENTETIKEDNIEDILNPEEDDEEIMPNIILAVAKYYTGTAIEILSNELVKYLNNMVDKRIDLKDITYM